MKNITAIIFDLGAVILNIKYENTINEFERLGLKNASSFYSKKIQSHLFNQIEIGKISEREFLCKLKEEMPNACIMQIRNAWNNMLLDLPERRLKLLQELKISYPIFLLSNTNAIHISELKRKLGKNNYSKFCNLFNKIYYSHKIGVRKPSIKAFQLILNENNLLANEVLFIDDSLQHIKAAKEIGINTYHLQDNEEVITLFPDIVL
tara:strand:- start:1984 stop:2604 length:621 start_codon:yes stop_codon:yes gene_type:complete